MAYTISQALTKYPENDNVWEDAITSDNEPGYFIAITSNSLEEGAAERVMTVQMFNLPQAPAENEAHSGAYLRGSKETSVKAVLLDQEGKEVATNVTDYPK